MTRAVKHTAGFASNVDGNAMWVLLIDYRSFSGVRKLRDNLEPRFAFQQ
jgi:hypothetical protein